MHCIPCAITSLIRASTVVSDDAPVAHGLPQVPHQVPVRTSVLGVPVPRVRGPPVSESLVVFGGQDDISAMGGR